MEAEENDSQTSCIRRVSFRLTPVRIPLPVRQRLLLTKHHIGSRVAAGLLGLVVFFFHITLSWLVEGWILFGSTRTNFPEGAVDADRFTN